MKYLYAIDGDEVGKKIENALFNDDLAAAAEVSGRVESALHRVNGFFIESGAETVFLAGDSVLLMADHLIDCPEKYLQNGEITFSMGIGNTPSDAVLALKKAKGLGKNRIVRMV